jgi:hypothetical protein
MVTNHVRRKGGKDSAEITDKTKEDEKHREVCS